MFRHCRGIASSPPCTFGCSVLDPARPSFREKPVSSDTSVTFNPAAAIAFAVPPVETRVDAVAQQARGRRSIRPDLSETDNRARGPRGGRSCVGPVLQGPPRSMVFTALETAGKKECATLSTVHSAVRAKRANPESRTALRVWIPGSAPKRAHPGMTVFPYNGNSGSRRALRFCGGSRKPRCLNGQSSSGCWRPAGSPA